MPEVKSALYNRTVSCPACGLKTTQADFKTGMYAEEERESDQHVTKYRWLQADTPPLHPPFYALCHCPDCAFTDFREDFFEPARSRGNLARVLAPRLKSELQRRGSAIAILHRNLPSGPIEFPLALRLHLLAIAAQELLPEDRRDHLKIARLYLRTAWLYREQTDTAEPSLQESEGLAALDHYAACLRELISAVDRLVTVHATSPERPRLDGLAKQVQGIGAVSAELRARLLSSAQGSNGLGFLTLLRGEWPNVPTDESASLAAAVRGFERVYEHGEGDTMALLKLMIELNYRLGQFERVMEYAASISKTAYEERATLQRQLADRELSAEERNRLSARSNRLQSTLDLAADIRRQVAARQTAAQAA